MSVEHINELLKNGLDSVFREENFKRYLKAMSMFHQYSYRNILLIFSQHPTAEAVASYATWKKLKRNVKRGQKGIMIFTPIKKSILVEEEKEGEKIKVEKQYITFKPGYVFDISQTEGEPLPKIEIPNLAEDVEHYEYYLMAMLNCSTVPVIFRNFKNDNEALGFYHRGGKFIAIKNGLSEMETLSVLLHEMAHAKLHEQDGLSKQIKELEAEATAFVVMHHFGFDTSSQAFPYLAIYSKGEQLEEFEGVLKNVQLASSSIIKQIETTFEKNKLLDFSNELLGKVAYNHEQSYLMIPDVEKYNEKYFVENINYHDLSRDELVVGVDNYSTKIAHKLNQEPISIHDVEKILEGDESRFNQLENNVNRLGGNLSLKSEFELIKEVIPNTNTAQKVSLKDKLKQAKQVSQAVNQTKKLVMEKGGEGFE